MSCSTWEEAVSGVPQVLILGPFLFIIFFRDLFFERNSHYFINYADGATPYVIGGNATKVLTSLWDVTHYQYYLSDI